MCIGGEHDGYLISYLEHEIRLPIHQDPYENLNLDSTPVYEPIEKYRLEQFRFNGEKKYFYIYSKFSNEEVLKDIQKRWHQMDK
ncbi:hypothetical protein [Acinetobacter sp. MD2(2019)]|uniref:hypothetical protein n=1 Tax=Acinetobacter sp. MD2(2019) TaxID=2605273 RepID=UPI002D1E90A4|nr:hypothetical protein [Acinetobacter sp. MD2(2019)]MEB3754700.1 hypothetical protein [Acinetobacter sp. MD2(2019)]